MAHVSELDEARLQQGGDIARSLLDQLRTGGTIPATYPLLFRGGVAEGSLHSFMVSALLLLGHRLGYSSVCDSAMSDDVDRVLLGEGARRPDSIWYERGTDRVRVLVEFERYKANALQQKARNLLLQANACKNDVQLLVLMWWTEAARAAADLGPPRDVFVGGFQQSGSRYGPSLCPVLMLETLVKWTGNRLAACGFTARLFVFGRENKPYIVDSLNSP
jgi:hypothetical protein